MKNVGASQEEQATGERSTRNRVARSILDHGASTTADLAERLGLTQAAVRRHLDHLVAENIVEPREQRVYGARTRGRPAKVFSLTDSGRDAFDQAYDQIAADALRWIAKSAGGGEKGDAAVTAFARARVAAQADRYRATVEAAEPALRTQALAKALSEDGYAATTRSASAVAGQTREPAGEQLCQHHCPVAHIAEEFPQLCEAEAEVFSHLLGTHVQRLATIAHGDGVCTTYIPQHPHHPQPSTAPNTAPSTASTANTANTAVDIASASTAGRNPA
ncbi:winged helix-turn-helix transcriptional regulator [Streptomyces sp. H10-C2]|uniref:helix-turn-helix transcriptional regulator n=1 Tax=unclassified Streptomyces TaxID=2593676 RepID=UPI0024B96923|nr:MULTISPECIES: winged helix-turn-helix transcriptional regulator [unclassified Streptomyces]MDJ0345456.1 winged helix-turn-helix transcriptional regulator [Streptomyces sp. PH10-H1]MDJ0374280.1 winged helix-turn-helix transcriptional regulator [Streptomyces sp. H10-C2]